MKGIFQEKPPRPKYTEIWEVSVVLSYLQSPVDKLPLKELTMKLVLILLVSGQRGQTVHLLSIDHMVSVNSCYTFQIVDHLKQSRPGVKNPLVELRPAEDDSLCCHNIKGVLKKDTIFMGLRKPIVYYGS